VKRYLGIFFVLSVFLIGSCATQTPPPVPVEPKPTYTEKFISVQLKADSQLNLYGGSSHALHLCIYQLSDPNAFNQLSENEMGIGKLLACDRVDAGPPLPGVAIAKKLIMQPGEVQTLELDRAEGAKYVGIVAGYYQLLKRQVTRLYTIPTTEERDKGMIVIKQKPLKINLFLGPQALQD
jgi:predicted component of type VI protein secretion system